MASLIFTNLSFNIFSLTKKKVGFNLAEITLRQLSLIIRSIKLSEHSGRHMFLDFSDSKADQKILKNNHFRNYITRKILKVD